MNIFYSWQSDLPNSTNRGFIKKAIEGAAKELHQLNTLAEPPRLDSDTQGEPGAPDIANTIFEKIEACDVFIADVSIINHGVDKQRPAPNPNVLVELGYALKTLGSRRILMVQNTAHGAQTDLPFDLRYRRVVPYSLLPTTKPKSVERKNLQSFLKSQLEAIADDMKVSSTKVGALINAHPMVNWHELYFSAIDRLDAASLEKRLAAIHTLENIAKNSPEHHWPVVELFTTALQLRLSTTNNTNVPTHVEPDTQAIITALGRRKRNHDYFGLEADSAEAQDRRINLCSLYIHGANFANLHFERGAFIGSTFEYCFFDGCHLEEAIFQRSVFGECSFGSYSQNGRPAHCQHADFVAATFKSGYMIKTDFRKANLSGAKFGNFNSDNHNAPYMLHMNEVHLEGAVLDGASFLARMQLHNVNFRLASMKSAGLQGVDLSLALNLSPTQKAEARSDDKTRWPSYLEPAANDHDH